MKRTVSVILAVTFLTLTAVLSTGCFKKRVPKNWYQVTLDYYTEGVRTNWANEDPSLRLSISADLKDYSKKRGYLLVDLDNDGVDELLVGYNDSSNFTVFTDVIVWHSDLGAYKLLGAGNGSYIGLCQDNVLVMKDNYEKKYLKWQSKSNSFLSVDGEGKYLPTKWDITYFK